MTGDTVDKTEKVAHAQRTKYRNFITRLNEEILKEKIIVLFKIRTKQVVIKKSR